MNKKGITLVEMLAVVAILAVLVIIAVPDVIDAFNRAKEKTVINEINTLYDTAKMQYPLDKSAGYVAKTAMYCSDIDACRSANPTLKVLKLDTAGEKSLQFVIKVNQKGDVESMYVTNTKYEYSCSEVDLSLPSCKDKNIHLESAPLDTSGNLAGSPDRTITIAKADECFGYELKDDGTAKIVSYNKECSKNVVIPAYIDKFKVTEIYQCSFQNLEIESVYIPTTVTSIGYRAFYNNKIRSLTIPSNVKTIGKEAFLNNKQLSSLTLNEGLTSIGVAAFKNCNISKVDENLLPSDVGSCAFCYNPIKFENNFNYSADKKTVTGYKGDLSEFEAGIFRVPASTTDASGNVVPLKAIASDAFNTLNLSNRTVYIPETVETIGSSAFVWCGMKEVVFEGNSKLKSIGSSAFRDNKLTSLTIPASVTSIGSAAFNQNSVTTGDIWIYARDASKPNNIDYSKIVSYAGATKNNVVIPPEAGGVKLKSIGANTFSWKGLTGSVTIPNTVTEIGNAAFCGNSLTSVDDGTSFIYARKSDGSLNKERIIGYGNSHTDITIPNGVKEIGTYAFYYTYIKSVKFPETLTKIESNAFYVCRISGTVVIPSQVTSIGGNAFYKIINWTNMNSGMNKIVNKTGKAFNWKNITGTAGTYKVEDKDGVKRDSVVTGTIYNYYGNIDVVDSE